MELIVSLMMVFFFVILNEVRVAFLGNDHSTSEALMLGSSGVFGYLLYLIFTA